MSDIPSETGLTAAQRDPLIPGRATLTEIAAELRCCERSAYNLMSRLGVPYIRVLTKRFYDRDAVRAALLRGEVNRASRGRGRPAKAA